MPDSTNLAADLRAYARWHLADVMQPDRLRLRPGTGAASPRHREIRPLTLTIPEVAALIASLTARGPTATDSSASAMRAPVRSVSP